MPNRPSVVESLESRQLLAAHFVNNPMELAYSVPQSIRATAKAGPKPVVVESTALVGTWDGTAKVSKFFYSRKFDLSLDITGQTVNSATGSVTVDGRTYTGALKGVYRSNNTFKYTIKEGRRSLTIEGQMNPAGTYAEGKLSAKYNGWSLGGTFKVSKQA